MEPTTLLTSAAFIISCGLALNLARYRKRRKQLSDRFNREAIQIFRTHNQNRYHEMNGWRK